MDCEKFENTLLDELYGELDEVTSAAAKRHVSGCARCTALFSGLKATKRVAVLPVVMPPADLEERILRAAREAQKVVPMGGRLSRAVSLAGSWAMRPQAAMAALFLLMIGTSTLFLKGKSSAPSSGVTVHDQGEPVASVAMLPPLEHPPEAAHAEAKSAAAPVAAAATAVPSPSPSPSAGAYAQNDSMLDSVSRGGGPPGRAASRPYATPPAAPPREVALSGDLERGSNAPASAPLGQSAYGGYATPPPAAAAMAPAQAPKPLAKDDARFATQSPASMSAGGGAGGAAGSPAPAAAQQAPSAFDVAKSAFDAGDFGNARDKFDALYQTTSDPSSEVYAARSEMGANGCTSAAITRFETVIAAAPASRAGYDAKLYEAQCYQSVGDNDDARMRLGQLLTVPSHQSRAQRILDAIGAKGGGAAKAARAAPAPKQQQQQQPPAAAAPPATPPNATTNAY